MSLLRTTRGGGLVSSLPSNALFSRQYGWLLLKYLRCPIYTFFPNAVERLVVTWGPHSRHPLYPFVTCPDVSPYAGKSCMHQISIALREHVQFPGSLDTSVALLLPIAIIVLQSKGPNIRLCYQMLHSPCQGSIGLTL
jgi:hypothetical protein